MDHVLIHLGLIEDIGPAAVQKIVDAVGLQNLGDIYGYSLSDFGSIGFDEKRSQLLLDGLADIKSLERELQLIEKHDVTIVTRDCVGYSPLLAQIHVPPVVLYCQGNTSLLLAPKTIACVGARKAHRYALEAFQELINPMISQGWVVVSGGAAGADTYAHQSTIDAGGATIVVVGTGLCHIYPPQNKKLFQAVVQAGGLIVSIFPMNTPPEPRCFPARNRIISGLSLGCVVFQAAQKSGALITAVQALDQGREVFAVPGSIFDPLSAGCHGLISQGAKLVASAEDILVEFGGLRAAEELQPAKAPKDRQLTIAKAAAFQAYPSGSIEQSIIDAVVIPMSSDGLMQKLGIDLARLQSVLFDLSLEGLIRQDDMGFWVRV